MLKNLVRFSVRESNPLKVSIMSMYVPANIALFTCVAKFSMSSGTRE